MSESKNKLMIVDTGLMKNRILQRINKHELRNVELSALTYGFLNGKDY